MTEDVLFVCKSPGMGDPNIWDDNWGEQGEDWSGGGGTSKRLVPSGPQLGASLYELGLKQLTARSRFPSQSGGPLFVIHDLGEQEA
jgi:hypothetical protein